MRTACNHAGSMARMIQIRNVPEDLHRKLKARAASLGLSLSDYLLGEIRTAALRPTLDEWLERVARREPARTSESSADAIRSERDAR